MKSFGELTMINNIDKLFEEIDDNNKFWEILKKKEKEGDEKNGEPRK